MVVYDYISIVYDGIMETNVTVCANKHLKRIKIKREINKTKNSRILHIYCSK